MEFLLDTNICIYIIKKKPISVVEQFEKYSIGSIAISSITLAEMEYGAKKSTDPQKNLEAFYKFITPLEIVDFDFRAAMVYGDMRYYLEKKGTPIGPLDTLIAAQAISNKMTLVTNNEKEFIRIPNLMVVNWVNQI